MREIVGDGVASGNRSGVRQDDHDAEQGNGHRSSWKPPPQRAEACPEQDGESEDHQRSGSIGRAHGETGSRSGHEGLEQSTEGCRAVVGVCPHGPHHADNNQEDEVRTEPPAKEGSGNQR